jgi:hypothetical protein
MPLHSGFLSEIFEWLEKHETCKYLRYILLITSAQTKLPSSKIAVMTRVFPNPENNDLIEPIVFLPHNA